MGAFILSILRNIHVLIIHALTLNEIACINTETNSNTHTHLRQSKNACLDTTCGGDGDTGNVTILKLVPNFEMP